MSNGNGLGPMVIGQSGGPLEFPLAAAAFSNPNCFSLHLVSQNAHDAVTSSANGSLQITAEQVQLQNILSETTVSKKRNKNTTALTALSTKLSRAQDIILLLLYLYNFPEIDRNSWRFGE